MAPKRKPAEMRDDAQLQPESGYATGRQPTKPSAHPRADSADDESPLRRGSGSEAEFGKLDVP